MHHLIKLVRGDNLLKRIVTLVFQPVERYFHRFVLYKELQCYDKQIITLSRNMNSNIIVKENYYTNLSHSCRTFSVTSTLAKDKNRGKEKKVKKPQHIDFNELSEVLDVDELKTKFEAPIEHMKNNYTKHVSLRSSVGALEELPVKLDGKDYTLQELAEISRKPKLVVLDVSLFPQAIPQIMKVLRTSAMNLNPQQDGNTIYITIPKITKEHRENMAKTAKAYFIKCRDAIKNVRTKYINDVQEEIKDMDLSHRIQGYIEVFSNQYIAQAEQIFESKQKELLGASE